MFCKSIDLSISKNRNDERTLCFLSSFFHLWSRVTERLNCQSLRNFNERSFLCTGPAVLVANVAPLTKHALLVTTVAFTMYEA